MAAAPRSTMRCARTAPFTSCKHSREVDMPLYVATRKGLFIIDTARWTLGRPHFLGDPVTAVLAHGGVIYAALNLGHFGVKVRRSDDRGERWQEIAAPAYPPKPDASPEKTPWKLVQIWT